MGIVNIDDELHDQIRRASSVSSRSINAQAGFWIRIGMLCEMNPTLSFNEVMAAEMRAARLWVSRASSSSCAQLRRQPRPATTLGGEAG